MSHSKGLFAGTCNGEWRWYGRKQEHAGRMRKQQKCSKCGKVRWKYIRKCFMFHQYRPSGKANHGVQWEKCERCADRRKGRARQCGGVFGRMLGTACSFHKCDKQEGVHCARCLTPR